MAGERSLIVELDSFSTLVDKQEAAVDVLVELAFSYRDTGNSDAAMACLELGSLIARDMDDVARESTCQVGLGSLSMHSGNYTKSAAYYERAVHLDKRLGDAAEESADLRMVGLAYLLAEQPDRAIPPLQAATDLAQRQRRPDLELAAISLLTKELRLSKRYDEARKSCEQWLAVARSTGDHREAQAADRELETLRLFSETEELLREVRRQMDDT